jgi:hypothetical protein
VGNGVAVLLDTLVVVVPEAVDDALVVLLEANTLVVVVPEAVGDAPVELLDTNSVVVVVPEAVDDAPVVLLDTDAVVVDAVAEVVDDISAVLLETTMHCEYQSFCLTHVNPPMQQVAPSQSRPPHWSHSLPHVGDIVGTGVVVLPTGEVGATFPVREVRIQVPDAVSSLAVHPPFPLAPGISAEHDSDLSLIAQFASEML